MAKINIYSRLIIKDEQIIYTIKENIKYEPLLKLIRLCYESEDLNYKMPKIHYVSEIKYYKINDNYEYVRIIYKHKWDKITRHITCSSKDTTELRSTLLSKIKTWYVEPEISLTNNMLIKGA